MEDFNLPDIDWSLNDCRSLNNSPLAQMFIDMFNILGYMQWIKNFTFYPSANILDFVLTTEHNRVGGLDLLPPFPDCSHCGVVFYYYFEFPSESMNGVGEKKSLFNGNYQKIEYYLQSFDWSYELQCRSVNGMFLRILEILSHLVNRSVPKYSSSPGPFFSTQPPAGLKRVRTNAWKCYKDCCSTHGRRVAVTQEALNTFNNLNKQYRTFFINSQITMRCLSSIQWRSPPKSFIYMSGRTKLAPPLQVHSKRLKVQWPMTVWKCLKF